MSIRIKTGIYKLAAVSQTHNQLLFRLDTLDRNYDLLFEGVKHMAIDFTMPIEKIIQGEFHPGGLPLATFWMHHQGLQHKIICARILYQENQLLPDESSIPSDREPPGIVDEIIAMAKEGKLDPKRLEAYRSSAPEWEVLFSTYPTK